MDEYELAILRHYTGNGRTQIAMIPQYAVPPGETWSIDFVGVDLRHRSLLFIEVSCAQTPSCVDKIRRRDEWIPIVRAQLSEQSGVVDNTWKHLTVVFVIDSRVDWMRERLGHPQDVIVQPLSSCFPYWLTGKEPAIGQPCADS